MSVQTELNRADPNRLADLFRNVNIGSVIQAIAGTTAIEETVTVSSNVGHLANRALEIVAVSVTAGTVTGAATPCSASVTPATHNVQVGTDMKTLTFLAGDAVTAAKVTYVPAPAGLETALAALFQGQ